MVPNWYKDTCLEKVKVPKGLSQKITMDKGAIRIIIKPICHFQMWTSELE